MVKNQHGLTQAFFKVPFWDHCCSQSSGLSSKPKLFADDISIFNVVHDINTSGNELNNYLKKVSHRAFQWKRASIPTQGNRSKRLFLFENWRQCHTLLWFIIILMFSQWKSQRHLGIILDSKLTFKDHNKTVSSKTNRTIALLRKLQNLLPGEPLITIYKAFARPHLNYGDVLSDQAFNVSSHEKLESI